jgi:chromatin segregation and condensation protein Rec8/ScpA/Scc1 (kleisin family)
LTSEEFEAAGWSKRTKKMLANLQTAFQSEETLSYAIMTQGKSRYCFGTPWRPAPYLPRLAGFIYVCCLRACVPASRKVAAAVLLELLVLKTKGYIEVAQTEPFADIQIFPTANVEA